MKRPGGAQYAPDSFEAHVLEEGFGIPLELSEAPTTSGGQLPRHGDSGYYGTNFYINLGGNTYRLSMTLV